MTTPDPYKVLQVDSEAEAEVIEAAFRRLARKYHPDVAAGPEAAERMVQLNRAWEILRDPARRAALDLARRGGPEGRTVHADGSPSQSAATPGRQGPAGERASGPGGTPPGTPPGTPKGPQPETVSRDWTSGRSFGGGGYNPETMRAAEGTGAAGPPPGNPSGTVLRFGRYAGWSLGEIARRDLEYVEWLDRTPIGRPYRDEIDGILRRVGRRRSANADATERRGLFRRR